MTTEEPQNSAPTLPNYPELIMTAIEELKDPNGSSKSAISSQIESTLPDIPASHTTLLTHHLNNLKQTGQLIMLKDNYIKPDPALPLPPKRGRGRPPKANKDPVPSEAVTPRARGRPPKPRDPFEGPTKVKSPSGRPRGRPPKKAKTGSGEPRGRGRPPKVKAAVAAVAG